MHLSDSCMLGGTLSCPSEIFLTKVSLIEESSIVHTNALLRHINHPPANDEMAQSCATSATRLEAGIHL